jgi:hypothetical protein
MSKTARDEFKASMSHGNIHDAAMTQGKILLALAALIELLEKHIGVDSKDEEDVSSV